MRKREREREEGWGNDEGVYVRRGRLRCCLLCGLHAGKGTPASSTLLLNRLIKLEIHEELLRCCCFCWSREREREKEEWEGPTAACSDSVVGPTADTLMMKLHMPLLLPLVC